MDEQIYLYLYAEDGIKCDLCNEKKIELFECNLCHFVCCPKCFYGEKAPLSSYFIE